MYWLVVSVEACLFLINLVLRWAHTRGHVAGTHSGDMLQREFSSCDIPVFAKKSCCEDRICPCNMLHEIQLV